MRTRALDCVDAQKMVCNATSLYALSASRRVLLFNADTKEFAHSQRL